jgi:predicted DNA-binding protein
MPAKGYSAITIPEETHRILKRVSAERGRSMSNIASEAIRKFVGEEGGEYGGQTE